jgi:hypothetical protein
VLHTVFAGELIRSAMAPSVVEKRHYETGSDTCLMARDCLWSSIGIMGYHSGGEKNQRTLIYGTILSACSDLVCYILSLELCRNFRSQCNT